MNVKFYSLSTRPAAVEGAKGSFVNVTSGEYAGMWYCTGSDYMRLDNVAQEHGGEVTHASIDTTTGIASFKNADEDVLFRLELSDYIAAEIAKLEGSATIATSTGGVVTIKGGVTEENGKISNSDVADITLAKVATTGKAEDITLDPSTSFGTTTQTTVQGAFEAVATAFNGLATQLEGLVDAEETRATTAENALDARLDTLEGTDTVTGSVAYAVKQEETRAKTAEETNATAISAEESRATTAETSLATAISAEESRATAAEGVLTTNVSANATAISAEESRATTAETSLANRIKALEDDSADADALATEVSRATAAEEALEDRLDTLEGDGEGSVKKAVADGIASVVANADSDFDTLKEVAEWIAADKTRAAELTATVSSNTSAISNLQAAVDENTDDIEAEVSRATAAEGVLTTNVSANATAISNLQTAVSTNTSAISALESSRATTSYVDTQDEATLSSAKDYADGLASNYATAAQGAKADTALQGVQFNGTDMTVANNKVNLTVATGTANGTIAVNGTDIAVKGLGSAAYTDSSAYDAAGSATAAETNAKAYADTQDATTLSSAKAYADTQDATTLASANAYTDGALTWLTTFPTA